VGYYTQASGRIHVSPKIKQNLAVFIRSEFDLVVSNRTIVYKKHYYKGLCFYSNMWQFTSLVYFLSSKGYVCNGRIKLRGDYDEDTWSVMIVDNKLLKRHHKPSREYRVVKKSCRQQFKNVRPLSLFSSIIVGGYYYYFSFVCFQREACLKYQMG
jgi:hypothetical protein